MKSNHLGQTDSITERLYERQKCNVLSSDSLPGRPKSGARPPVS